MSNTLHIKGLGKIEGLKTTIVYCVLYTVHRRPPGGGGRA